MNPGSINMIFMLNSASSRHSNSVNPSTANYLSREPPLPHYSNVIYYMNKWQAKTVSLIMS